MTDRSETHSDPLEGLRAEMFKHTRYAGMDALVAVIPKGQETPAEVKQAEDDAGEGRWFPFEGGWKVKCPYTDESFDPAIFHIEKGGWDHVECDGCQGSIDTGASCWVAKADDECFIFCDGCYDRLKEKDAPAKPQGLDSQPA
jgi:hypothetical protein